MRLTLADIARSKVAGINQHLFSKPVEKAKGESKIGGRLVVKHFLKKSSAINFIELALIDWAQRNGQKLYEEFRFCEERRYRFDYALPGLMTAFEYDGGINTSNGDHRSRKGVQRDIDKGNLAQQKGWKVLRFTALNYKTIIDELMKLNDVQTNR
jgi:very-short-patch-repair endonuclease